MGVLVANNNNMKPQHQLITFAILCLLLVIGLNHCAKEKPKVIPFDYKAEAEMMKKQFGIEQAILLNQLEAVNRRLQVANNAKDSIRQRELSLSNTNIALLKKLRQVAMQRYLMHFNFALMEVLLRIV